MSDELNETGFEPEEEEVPAPKRGSFFASLLDLVAGASVIGGFIAGILQDMGGGWMFLFILSGVLGAALWHLCALIAEAVEKYLGDD